MSGLLSLVLFIASVAIYATKAGRNKWWFSATLLVLGLFVLLNITLYASNYFTGDGINDAVIYTLTNSLTGAGIGKYLLPGAGLVLALVAVFCALGWVLRRRRHMPHHFGYSLLALAAFGVIGCMQLHRALKKIGCPRGKKALTAAACAASLLLAWFATPNAFLRGQKLEQLAQGRLAAVMPEGATLLQYSHLDDGLYLAAHTLPREKYFVLLNVQLEAMRDALDRAVREGRWDRRVFPEICGSVFGVLGFGAAGREIALRARAFGAEVLAYDKYPNYAFAEQIGAKIVSLDEVLEQSDIISVNLPALPDTLHIINAENIARMRDGVVIVNAARGVLADETAVAAALESGKIFAYATDVYESEPVQGDSPLIHCKRAVLSPHLAGESTNSYRKIGNATAEGVLAVLAGGEVPHRLA